MTTSITSLWNTLKSGQPLLRSAVQGSPSAQPLIALNDWLALEAAQDVLPDWVSALTLYQQESYADALKLLEKRDQADLSVLLLETLCLLHLEIKDEKFKRYRSINYLRDIILPRLRQAALSDKSGRLRDQIERLERFSLSQGY